MDQPWSKSKKKRMRKQQYREQNKNETTKIAKVPKRGNNDIHLVKETSVSNETLRNPTTTDRLGDSSDKLIIKVKRTFSSVKPKSTLQEKFIARLSGSRFRELNEELYTTTSETAFKRFVANPELYDQYHRGFRTQVQNWPVNPIDIIIQWLINFQKKHKAHETCVVADFGCGDAMLAKTLLSIGKGKRKNKKRRKNNVSQSNDKSYTACPFTVHSFDLVSNDTLVTACDMANVPLKSECVDIGVFCLALMGTNIADFIREAHRILRKDGVLKIAEIRSRFESAVESQSLKERNKNEPRETRINTISYKKQNDETLLDDFLDFMKQLGFYNTVKDQNNQMFVLLEFKKTGDKPCKEATYTAKPCIYKRR